ncbi:MAG TPA: hypothetical protein VFC39_15425 [Acidobacteriaceae bacterium]|nr:hypothetical protein [Acidobacteriaceae bacterium]
MSSATSAIVRGSFAVLLFAAATLKAEVLIDAATSLAVSPVWRWIDWCVVVGQWSLGLWLVSGWRPAGASAASLIAVLPAFA